MGTTCGSWTAYPSGASDFTPFSTCLGGVCVVDVKLHMFTILGPCCDVRYEFRVKMILDSSYRLMFYIFYLYLFTSTCVQHNSISDDVRFVWQ
jgi:hypothetical protein